MLTIPDQAVEAFIDSAVGRIDILGNFVPAINAPVMLVDALRDKLLEEGDRFAVMYWDEPEGRVFLLLSKEGGEDVSQIALHYGGTGDARTAIFRTPPQREMAGEFIPVEAELPPDNTVVIGLLAGLNGDGSTWAEQVFHRRDGDFDTDRRVVAWAWMPELPGFKGGE